MEARGCNKTLARGVRHASLSTRASAGARRGRSRCGRGKPTGAGGCPPQPAPIRKVSVRAGSPRGRTKSPRGGKRKGGGGHHHHHQNTPQVDELLGLVRKNRLEDCVRVLSNYSEDVRRETFGSKYLRKTFLDYAKKVGASREAFCFLIEADKVDANCHTSSSLAGSKAESASNLIYYDTRMAGRVIGVCARNGDSRLATKSRSRGDSNRARSLTSQPSGSRTRPSTRATESECPPNSKKCASREFTFRPRTSVQIPATSSSFGDSNCSVP